MQKAQRSSNIELLRIVCILMVIAGHYYCHGGWTEGLSPANTIFLKIFGGGSKLAVNCFVLITGYFGAQIETKRVLPLIRDRWFYSVFLTIVLVAAGISSLNAKLLFKTVFPLLSCRHNYITVFVMLYFFIPFLNAGIAALGKKGLEKFLIVAIGFTSIIPTVYPAYANNAYAYLFWMMLLFCIGRYVGTYKPAWPWKTLLAVSVLVLMVLVLVLEPHVGFYSENRATTVQYSFPLLVASVSTLGVFSHLKMRYNKVINGLARSTFAVYILHDDPDVRAYIYDNLFHNSNYGQSPYLWLHFICVVALIYLVCVAIDKVYRLTFYKLLTQVPLTRVEQLLDRFCHV